MALYNVQSAIAKVQTIIEEAADSNIITENELISAVSDAQKWVAAEARCYQSWSTITLGTTVRYSPPANTSGVLSLEYDYGSDIGVRSLLMVEPDNVPHAPDFNHPYYWHYRGNYISIYPLLATSPLNATVNVLIVTIPASLTALTDNLAIPDEFQIVIPYKVAELVAIKDNQLPKASYLAQKVQELIKVGIAQYAHQGRASASGEGGTSGGAS